MDVGDENINNNNRNGGNGYNKGGGGGGGSIAGQMFWNLGNVARKVLFSLLSVGPIPEHVAFIMDGNRRYEKKWGLTEGGGHNAGFVAFTAMLKYCYELGVKYVSAYAFSVDNYRRKPQEVRLLMEMLQFKMEELVEVEGVVHQFGVRIYFCGNLDLLTPPLKDAVLRAMSETKHNTKAVLCVCIAYASTEEITHSIHQCVHHHLRRRNNNNISSNSLINPINPRTPNGSTGGGHQPQDDRQEQVMEMGIQLGEIEEKMYMAIAPDADIIMRTGGETRLSNFMLWQGGGSLLCSPSALWPEIGLFHLIWSVLNFQRHRPYLDKKKRQLQHHPHAFPSSYLHTSST